MSVVQLDVQDNGVAIVTLNRPEKRNAMSFAMLKQLVETAKHIQKNRHIRCVIIQGAGQVFSSGIDLKDLNNPKNRLYAGWELLKPGNSIFQQACLIWQKLPIPVICAIEGYCFGAGLQLALAADIRIATPETQFSIMESRWGLVPDMGLTHSLRDLIGIDHAKELTMTARIFDGLYAKQLGLITHLNEQPLTAAQQLAAEILQRSPDAVAADKKVLYSMQFAPQRALRLEKILQLKLLLGKNSQIARRKDRQPDLPFQQRTLK